MFFLLMLALVLVGFSATLYLLADRYLYRQVDDRLDTVLNTLSGAVEAGPGGVEWEPANRQLSLDFSILGDQVAWLVADHKGRLLDRSKGHLVETFLADAPPSLWLSPNTNDTNMWEGASWKAGRKWFHADTQHRAHADIVPSPAIGESLYPLLSITAGVSITPVRTTLRQLAIWLVGLSVGIWLVAFFTGRFVCRRALLPVRHMAVAAGEIHADDLAQRLPNVGTKDELEELSRAFNALLDRLQESFERQRRFTGDASHQLRTPLTAILGQVEVALRRERPAEEYRVVLATVQHRATYLTRVVESLLFLARADSEAQLSAPETLNLAEWLPNHLYTWSEHPRSTDIALEYMSSKPSIIEAQPALLGELLNILLDNACKYSERGTPIKVRLEQVQNAVSLKVKDQGFGIEESDVSNLFMPFCRSEGARHRGIEGVGLGLSIAKRLSDVLGADLSVTSQVGRGSCFTARFASRS
jgi:two-component system OmpR family sensor kinase